MSTSRGETLLGLAVAEQFLAQVGIERNAAAAALDDADGVVDDLPDAGMRKRRAHDVQVPGARDQRLGRGGQPEQRRRGFARCCRRNRASRRRGSARRRCRSDSPG